MDCAPSMLVEDVLLIFESLLTSEINHQKGTIKWLKNGNSKPNPDKRLRDVELVLKCLALHLNWKDYGTPMKGFLNSFMVNSKKMTDEERQDLLARLEDIFTRTCETIATHLRDRPFHLRGRINYGAMDSIFNAIAHIPEVPGDLEERYEALIADPEFSGAVTINTRAP